MRDYNSIRKKFYKKHSFEELSKQLNSFINQDLDLTELNDKGKAYKNIINYFFEENINNARSRRTKTKSPNDILNDDKMLDKVFNFIDSKPTFYTSNDINNLKSFFRNAGKYAIKVSNFSPNIARKIYEKYCPKQNANILDYSCGFGSRMLGCLTSKYNYCYYGIEPNTKVFQNLIKLGDFINKIKPSKYKLYCQGSETIIPELTNNIDLAFSSPPYFNLEIYCDEETQSIVKYPIYEDWLNNFVRNTLRNIKTYLKNDGLFILNTKNLKEGKAEPLLNDWIRIAENEGFILKEIIDIRHQSSKTSLNEYRTQKGMSNYTAFKEPLAVFYIKKEE